MEPKRSQDIGKDVYKRQKYYRALSKISVINRLHNRDRGFFENSIVKVSKILHLDKLLNTEKINRKLQNTIKPVSYTHLRM